MIGAGRGRQGKGNVGIQISACLDCSEEGKVPTPVLMVSIMYTHSSDKQGEKARNSEKLFVCLDVSIHASDNFRGLKAYKEKARRAHRFIPRRYILVWLAGNMDLRCYQRLPMLVDDISWELHDMNCRRRPSALVGNHSERIGDLTVVQQRRVEVESD